VCRRRVQHRGGGRHQQRAGLAGDQAAAGTGVAPEGGDARPRVVVVARWRPVVRAPRRAGAWRVEALHPLLFTGTRTLPDAPGPRPADLAAPAVTCASAPVSVAWCSPRPRGHDPGPPPSPRCLSATLAVSSRTAISTASRSTRPRWITSERQQPGPRLRSLLGGQGRRRRVTVDRMQLVGVVPGPTWRSDRFSGSDRANRAPSSTHRSRAASHATPSGSTQIDPAVIRAPRGRPVTWARSYPDAPRPGEPRPDAPRPRTRLALSR
jgi:hypothetical protein